MRQTLARRCKLFNEDNADYRKDQSDTFGEDFYLVPHSEEIWARIEWVAQDNRDALRHFVELAIWGLWITPIFTRCCCPCCGLGTT